MPFLMAKAYKGKGLFKEYIQRMLVIKNLHCLCCVLDSEVMEKITFSNLGEN